MLTQRRSGQKPGSDPLDGADRLGFAERGDDRVKVSKVVNLDVEVEGLEAAIAVNELQIDDVGVLGTKDSRHRPKSAWDVAKDHCQPRCTSVRAFTPGKI